MGNIFVGMGNLVSCTHLSTVNFENTIYNTQDTLRRSDAISSLWVDVDKSSEHGAFRIMPTKVVTNRINNNKELISIRKSSTPSTGEQQVINFLVSNCVNFQREYYFKDCYHKGRNKLLFFDFYLPDYNMCIEFDGAQHYHKNKKQNAIENDFIKTAYCYKNGIKLLRIKYDQVNNLECIICAAVDAIA